MVVKYVRLQVLVVHPSCNTPTHSFAETLPGWCFMASSQSTDPIQDIAEGNNPTRSFESTGADSTTEEIRPIAKT